MSAYDLLEDGFPHGTPAGYKQGCRSSHCPARDDGHLSCAQAEIRYHADYQYKKQVDQSMTPAQIHATDADVVRAAKAPTTATEYNLPAQITVADSVEPLDRHSPTPAAPAPSPVRKRSGRKPAPYGTNTRWTRGCRGDDCPNTPTCTEAHQAHLLTQRKPHPTTTPITPTPAPAAEPAAPLTAATPAELEPEDTELEPLDAAPTAAVPTFEPTATLGDVHTDIQGLLHDLAQARTALAAADERNLQLQLQLDVEKTRTRSTSHHVTTPTGQTITIHLHIGGTP